MNTFLRGLLMYVGLVRTLECPWCSGTLRWYPPVVKGQRRELRCPRCRVTYTEGRWESIRQVLHGDGYTSVYHLSCMANDFASGGSKLQSFDLSFVSGRWEAGPAALRAVRYFERRNGVTATNVVVEEQRVFPVSYDGSCVSSWAPDDLIAWDAHSGVSIDEAFKRATIAYRKVRPWTPTSVDAELS